MVTMEDPFPGEAMVAGLKDAVSPGGSPDADRAISEAKVLLAVLETVVVTGVPGIATRPLGDADSEKSGVDVETTESTTALLLVPPPPVAVIVSEKFVTGGASVAAESVRVDEPGTLMELGENAAVTPDGVPDTTRTTDPLSGLAALTDTLTLALAPCCSDTTPGDAEREREPKARLTTGCSSMPFGATPVWPCRKSNIPMPLTCTGTLTCWKDSPMVYVASNCERTCWIAEANGLLASTQLGEGISAIIVLPALSLRTR
jgi:hypothetical protein